MDKNTIMGFVLIAAVLIGFSIYNQPSEEQLAQQREQFVKDSLAAVKKANDAKLAQARQTKAEEAAKADTTALFHAALSGTASNIVLKNSKLELTLSTKGATVRKAIIKNYTGHKKGKDGKFDEKLDTKDLTLFDGDDQQLNFMLAAKDANIMTKDLFFTPSEQTDSTVTLTAQAGEGKSIVLTYRLGKDYMLHMAMKANGMAGVFAPNYSQMDVSWQAMCRQQERGFTFENR